MAEGLPEYLIKKYELAAEEGTGSPAQIDRNRRLAPGEGLALAWGLGGIKS